MIKDLEGFIDKPWHDVSQYSIGYGCSTTYAEKYGFDPKELSKEESFEKNRAFCRKILPTCEEFGVNVLVENSCKINMGDMYYPNSAKDILEFLSWRL